MSDSYKIKDPDGVYFITVTVIGWVDLFTRKEYRDILLGSLRYCQNKKGLVLYGYCIMSSHIHMIITISEGFRLEDTIRDFKKFTSKSIISTIKEIPESRKEWLLNKFSFEANRVVKGKNHKLWKDGYHAKQLENKKIMQQKLDYIHYNPVEAGIVLSPEEYLYSSAKNYSNLPEKLLKVTLME